MGRETEVCLCCEPSMQRFVREVSRDLRTYALPTTVRAGEHPLSTILDHAAQNPEARAIYIALVRGNLVHATIERFRRALQTHIGPHKTLVAVTFDPMSPLRNIRGIRRVISTFIGSGRRQSTRSKARALLAEVEARIHCEGEPANGPHLAPNKPTPSPKPDNVIELRSPRKYFDRLRSRPSVPYAYVRRRVHQRRVAA